MFPPRASRPRKLCLPASGKRSPRRDGLELCGRKLRIAFLQVGNEVFHTCSAFGRGPEEFQNANNYLDLTVLGRQEEWEEPGVPRFVGDTKDWLERIQPIIDGHSDADPFFAGCCSDSLMIASCWSRTSRKVRGLHTTKRTGTTACRPSMDR